MMERALMKINGGNPFRIYLEKRKTGIGKMLGLSMRKDMKKNHLMIFYMREQKTWSFNTRLMNFPLDIIGLTSRGFVVDTQENMRKNTNFRIQGFYILECVSGFIGQHRIKFGDLIKIEGL
jgi:uncharacterized membrane protein (UPF0127 family)